MSFPAFQAKSQRDVTHPPQFVVEGVVTTTSNYANKGGASPSFTAIGPESMLKRGSNPVFKEVRNVGQQNRTQTVLIREDHLATLSTPITDNNKTFIDRFINTANGVGTADESLTMLKGYTIDGTQFYEVYVGAVVSKGRIILDAEGFWSFEGEAICNEIYQATAHGLTGTPVLITAENADVPWKGTDSGGNSLTIDSVKYADFGMSFDVTWGHSTLRPSESSKVIWQKPTLRTIIGNIDIFVQDDLLDNDSVVGTAVVVTKVLKAAQRTVTFTDLVWNDAEGSADDPNIAESDIKSKAFTCDNVALA